MAYEKQTWATGDVVTAAKLNNMENGISGAYGLVVNAIGEESTLTLDATYEEIENAVNSGRYVAVKSVDSEDDGLYFFDAVSAFGFDSSNNKYTITAHHVYETDSKTGYPSYTDGESAPTI